MPVVNGVIDLDTIAAGTVSDLGSLNFDGTVGSSPTVLFEQVATATTAASNNSAKLIFVTSGHNLYYDGDGGASASGRTLLAHLEHAGMIEASNIVLTAG